ncbi:MAG: methenyltetrahydromethanopterin cyclohydrolase, partial [Gammaproteobacteria bacterium]|nr:methenyltetrahydromethanopterin cyclohydrolase [Gammaproteobacteria bacterium]
MTSKAGKNSNATPDITVPVQERVAALRANSAALRLALDALPNGTALIDAGINARGGLEAGRLIAEICMGGLGTVTLQPMSRFARWPWQLHVHSSNPVVACLASQYAGWSLNHGEGKQAYYAMGSGPARAMGSREKLYDELGYRLA